ncbi:dipeptide ABC transporter ATP-binding protein [Aeromicrobium ginsengisoli]|uniref:ABC transporter ATP-binding protein n=1 Tax=Aeromicrobium ginsengisoli TaxID=363867 RepID=A0A5M4F9W3_9ACTN|nr:ABC transporter ATP-binding protein [Aeromicrobium ginsengisoli]KAA1395134.1 ABC transporter ATP-binding protein [Aeromicrobium ginsengisoli]
MALTFTPAPVVATPTDHPVLEIDDLSVGFGPKGRERRVVENLTLSVRPGQVVALVGESGSGKSTTAHAALGLLPAGGRIVGGRITLGGHDVTHADDKAFRHHRGPVVGLVPQDPMVALNPTMRVGEQVAEAVRRRGVPKRSVEVEVVEVLERAGVDNPVVKARQYPHELSGGQRQRVLIAIALAGKPKLLVADEPTSALDATVQRRILDHLDRLVADNGTSLLLITHDLGVAVDRADHLVVMSQGRIVEQGKPAQIAESPQHEYTQRLLDAAPGLGRVRRPAPVPPVDDVVLRFDGVSKEFTSRSGLGSRSRARVLDDVTLDVHRGRTLALVGESGSGKTTALRIAMGLERPTSGRVLFDGVDVASSDRRSLRALRRRFQFVHQNPFAALDPKFSVRDLVAEPLESFRIGDRASRTTTVSKLLDQVALPASYLGRRPAELSGGQRQRVAIARALALEPELLLLDEPVSALDVSVQAQILDLLVDLQSELGLTYVLVSHDLAVVAEVSHQLAVLDGGRIVESGPTQQVFDHPEHALTRALLAAVPGLSLKEAGA